MKNSKWVAVAILVLALGVAGVLFGWNLLPDGASASEKGTYGPWIGTWIMIWVVFGMAVTLAGFLFAVGTGRIQGAALGQAGPHKGGPYV
jgi:hypothetical protein